MKALQVMVKRTMASVKCADISCKYLSERGTCKAKKIELSWHSVATMNEGRKEFLRCKQHEESADYKRIAKWFEEHK